MKCVLRSNVFKNVFWGMINHNTIYEERWIVVKDRESVWQVLYWNSIKACNEYLKNYNIQNGEIVKLKDVKELFDKIKGENK